MRLIYNILQLLILPLLIVAYPVFYLLRPEKGRALLRRCSIGLPELIKTVEQGPVIWIQALSVGEVMSVIPLVRALRQSRPDALLIFSTSTVSGQKLAVDQLGAIVHRVIYSPLDLIPVVNRYLRRLNPDLYILVETDFWPNLLGSLAAREVPVILVNGRISSRSMRRYRRLAFFFRPIFDHCDRLCLQTARDVDNLRLLGIGREKLLTLGNLKYAACNNTKSPAPVGFVKEDGTLFILCGSTHPGEEELILEALGKLERSGLDLRVGLAPRDISRTPELLRLARSQGLETAVYSGCGTILPPLLVIDTIGDLATLYRLADVAFIGGSLVEFGGHNPLEAAKYAIPVIFGPHMDNFSEIRRELLDSGGAFEVADSGALANILDRLVRDPETRLKSGRKAASCLDRHRGTIERHLELIESYL